MVACLADLARRHQDDTEDLGDRLLLSGNGPIHGLRWSDEEAGGCLAETVRWRSHWCKDVWEQMRRELVEQMREDESMHKVSAHWAWVEIQRAREAAAD